MFVYIKLAKELHAHNGKDEDDDGQDKTEVSQGTHGAANDANEQVECGPRLGKLEHTKLQGKIKSSVSAFVYTWTALSVSVFFIYATAVISDGPVTGTAATYQTE